MGVRLAFQNRYRVAVFALWAAHGDYAWFVSPRAQIPSQSPELADSWTAAAGRDSRVAARAPGWGPRMRVTARQKATRDALEASGRFVCAQDLHARMRAGGHRIGLTTVYRVLRALADHGEADVIITEEGQRAYRVCGSSASHHHLICRWCGRTAELPATALERWAAGVSRRHGYTGVSCTAEVFGTCPRCLELADRGREAGETS